MRAPHPAQGERRASSCKARLKRASAMAWSPRSGRCSIRSAAAQTCAAPNSMPRAHFLRLARWTAGSLPATTTRLCRWAMSRTAPPGCAAPLSPSLVKAVLAVAHKTAQRQQRSPVHLANSIPQFQVVSEPVRASRGCRRALRPWVPRLRVIPSVHSCRAAGSESALITDERAGYRRKARAAEDARHINPHHDHQHFRPSHRQAWTMRSGAGIFFTAFLERAQSVRFLAGIRPL